MHFSLILVFLIMIPVWVFASNQPILIDSLHIEAVSENSSEARGKAIEEGQKRALVIYLKKINSLIKNNDTSFIKAHDVATLVDDIALTEEKYVSNNYSATLQVTFNKDALDKFISKNDIKLATNSDNILLLPLFIRGEKRILWEDNNHWREAISTELPDKSKYFLPLGDFDDISIVTTGLVENGDFMNLAKLAEKYHTDKILVAIAHYHISKETNLPSLSIKLNFLEKSHQPKKLEKIILNKGQTLTELLHQAVSFITEAPTIEVKEKESTASTVTVHKYKVIVPISDLNEWIIIKKKLLAINVIELEMGEISPTQAVMSIKTSLTKDEIIKIIENNGLNTSDSNDLLTVTLNHT